MKTEENKKCRRCAKYRACTRTLDGKWICYNCKSNDTEIAKKIREK